MKAKHITALLVLASLFSCTHETDLNRFKDSDYEDIVTLNSIITPDSTISIVATKPYFFSDVHNEPIFVDDLKIELWINGEYRGDMTYDKQQSRYCSTIRPSCGDTISFFTGYHNKPVTATDVVPQKVVIEDISAERQGPMHIFGDNDYMITYYVTFSDNPNNENYYFIAYDQYEGSVDTWMGQKDYSYEFVFQQLAQTINSSVPGWEPYSPKGLPFCDHGINGTTHTLILKETVQVSPLMDIDKWTSMPRGFRLFAISKPYYNYLISLLCSDTSDDDNNIHSGMIDLGIAEPSKIYCNIGGGLGILGCYTCDYKSIDVIKELGAFSK